MLVTMVFQTLYFLIDLYWVGRLGTEAVAAVDNGATAAQILLAWTTPLALPRGAAFSLATLTAWRMLVTRARLQPGEDVLIWGIGGGVALAALQIANAALSSSSSRNECRCSRNEHFHDCAWRAHIPPT